MQVRAYPVDLCRTIGELPDWPSQNPPKLAGPPRHNKNLGMALEPNARVWRGCGCDPNLIYLVAASGLPRRRCLGEWKFACLRLPKLVRQPVQTSFVATDVDLRVVV